MIIIYQLATAQQSGNSTYGYNTGLGKADTADKLFLTDSTFIIPASVAMNVIADQYVVTFSSTEEAADVSECNTKMDKRINAFRGDLKKMGIADKDVFVDMTTQNKIYDYKVTANVAEQYIKGFELQKNIIIKFSPISSLDQIVIAASSHGIYDMVKVDYIVSDLPAVYAKLFDAAAKVIDQKKAMYTAVTHTTLSPSSSIYGEKIYSYYPPQLYKSYKAYESSDVYGQFNDYVVKDIRKSTTFYYDPINYSGFDTIINPAVTEPAVEFALDLQVKFSILK
jgi:uncharacterized protein YggE